MCLYVYIVQARLPEKCCLLTIPILIMALACDNKHVLMGFHFFTMGTGGLIDPLPSSTVAIVKRHYGIHLFVQFLATNGSRLQASFHCLQ